MIPALLFYEVNDPLQMGMLGDMFLWLVANLKQGVIYFIKQGGGNLKIAWVYIAPSYDYDFT